MRIFDKKTKGFTFIEILITVAIIGVLASITVIATTGIRMKSRDTKRISDANAIVNALQAYYDSNKTYPAVLIPGQPIASNGLTFLKEVPSNPVPRTDGGCSGTDYTYLKTSAGYKLTFCIGANNGDYPKGIVICKNGNCLVQDDCEAVVIDRDGFSYKTIEIGGQCWMAENLKTKTKPGGSLVVTGVGYGCTGNCGQPWPISTYSFSERYCMDQNTIEECNNGQGVYTWYAAMNVDPHNLTLPIEPSQGLCPDGWHIPTHDEFTILERSVCTRGTVCATDFPLDTTTTGITGDGEGVTLRSSTGFNFGYMGGVDPYLQVSCPSGWTLPYCSGGWRFHFTSGGDIWTSTTSGPVGSNDFHKAWFRNINTSAPTKIVRDKSLSKFTKVSVRCIKDQ